MDHNNFNFFQPWVIPVRAFIVAGGGVFSVFGSQLINFSGAGPLACITSAFVACSCWKKMGWSSVYVSQFVPHIRTDFIIKLKNTDLLNILWNISIVVYLLKMYFKTWILLQLFLWFNYIILLNKEHTIHDISQALFSLLVPLHSTIMLFFPLQPSNLPNNHSML